MKLLHGFIKAGFKHRLVWEIIIIVVQINIYRKYCYFCIDNLDIYKPCVPFIDNRSIRSMVRYRARCGGNGYSLYATAIATKAALYGYKYKYEFFFKNMSQENHSHLGYNNYTKTNFHKHKGENIIYVPMSDLLDTINIVTFIKR